jgi:hypothetical protein
MSTLAKILESTDGKFVTVSFIKKDGTPRTITGRLGVTKYLKNGKSTVNHDKYVILYSMQDDGYRCINKDTITSVVFGGINYSKV